MIQPIAQNAVRSGILAHYRQNIGRLGTNMGRLASHAVDEFIHEPHGFKNNALILSSLLLVLSRIVIVNKSALTAAPEDKDFRQFEAVKTTMREAGGWTASFLILRAIQKMTSKALEKFFQVEAMPGTGRDSKYLSAAIEMVKQPFKYLFGDSAGMVLENLKTKVCGIEAPLMEKTLHLGTTLTYQPIAGQNPNALGVRALNSLKKRLSGSLFGTVTETGIMRYLPVVIGSVPALLLSGFALEWFSNNKAKPVANFVAKNVLKDKSSPLVAPHTADTQSTQGAGPGITYPIGSLRNLVRQRQGLAENSPFLNPASYDGQSPEQAFGYNPFR